MKVFYVGANIQVMQATIIMEAVESKSVTGGKRAF
jgi:hypothetical protein